MRTVLAFAMLLLLCYPPFFAAVKDTPHNPQSVDRYSADGPRRLVAGPKDVSQGGSCPRGILGRLLAGRWKEYPMADPDRRTPLLESYENAAVIVSGIT